MGRCIMVCIYIYIFVGYISICIIHHSDCKLIYNGLMILMYNGLFWFSLTAVVIFDGYVSYVAT